MGSPDFSGLKQTERWMLERAKQGEALSAESARKVLMRLAGARRAVEDTRDSDASLALADAYRDVCQGFAVLHDRVGELEGQLRASQEHAATVEAIKRTPIAVLPEPEALRCVVTEHAVERFCERVRPDLSELDAHMPSSSPSVYNDADADTDADAGRAERAKRRLAADNLRTAVLQVARDIDQVTVRDIQQALTDRSPDQVAGVVWSMINGGVLAYNDDRTLRIVG